jgi:hypothetical protein
MQNFKSFSQKLENLSPQGFDELALELFQFQANHNPVYSAYLKARRIVAAQIKTISEIPFLPIQFFKDFDVISCPKESYPGFFSSSGTTGMITSKHYYWSESWYRRHCQFLFETNYGSLHNFHILALLPAYLERKGSSLVSMADHFIQESESNHSGFYLYNQQELVSKVNDLQGDGRKILLLGVTFALLDLAESGLPIYNSDDLIVMETGGMKGRRKEMIREDVHEQLKSYFHAAYIHSEYGMTELMSQCYSKGDGKYTIPYSMRVILRDVNDPLSISQKSQGGINIIDLANFHSCSFIETQDLGRFDLDGMLEVLGRFDASEVRGCNLMVQ